MRPDPAAFGRAPVRRMLRRVFVAALAAWALGRTAANAQSAAPVPSADFGQPPSGAVTILFNDRHVYTRPDRLKANRVLSALVRGNTILVPLRSMFEQTGATIRYDPATKTVDVSKPGSDVRVTVGRPEVVINGESRPLDVAPEIDGGAVLVPLRVISEGMGAYVAWVPERKTVVIRYVTAAAPPVPTPAPTAAPPLPQTPQPAPTATPKPRAKRAYHDLFVVGDYLFDPKVYNEFSPGNKGVGVSYSGRGAVEFPLFGLPWMLEGDYRSFRYPHSAGGLTPGDAGYVTVIGGYGQTHVPAFTARDTDVDGRIGLRIVHPRVYIGVGYLHREETYGYPKQNGFGLGAEKLADLDQTFSLYGSVYYYPNLSGNYAFVNLDPYAAANGLYGTTQKFTDRMLKYRIGVSILLTAAHDPLGMFVDGGFLGDSIRAKALSPADATHGGAYLGLGLKF